MPKEHNLLFWHNIVSPHIIYTIQALSDSKRFSSVRILAEELTVEWRKSMGWAQSFDTHDVIIDTGYDDLLVKDLLRKENNIHVFSGFFAYKKTNKVFLKAIFKRQKVLIITEVPDLRQRYFLKYIKYSILSFLFKRQIDKVLVIGNHAFNFYKKLGFKESQLIRYAYSTKSPVNSNVKTLNAEHYRIIFVGRLIALKNVGLILSSLGSERVKNRNWHLTIVGEGDEKNNLIQLATELSIIEKITFHDFMPNDKVLGLMAESDSLILSSKYDGWGAVVNESLSVGTPVICSDACGCAGLIKRNFEFGTVFNSNDKESLMKCILEKLVESKNDTTRRHDIVNLYSKVLSPSALADVFIKNVML